MPMPASFVSLCAASFCQGPLPLLSAVLDTLVRGVLTPPLPPPELERRELRQRMRELLEPTRGFETPQTLWGADVTTYGAAVCEPILPGERSQR